MLIKNLSINILSIRKSDDFKEVLSFFIKKGKVRETYPLLTQIS